MKFVSCLLTVVLGTTAGDWAQSPQYTNPILVPDAWPDYGIGDPFVLRFDGTYYLYSSTKDGRPGVRVWTSTNLVDWAFRGLAASDPSTTGAYGPEVILYEGWFWMATSPAGTGHRFSRARSPLGPFEPFTDNLGMTIDGSFFVDEGGNLLFYHASDRGILAHRLGPEGLPGPEILLEGTRMGHWTEGPFVFRRGEHWFLGMTGNHVLSAGYRENYAVSDQGPLGPFVQPENNPLVIHTTGEFRGLGHGSVVTGPDLVSTWLVYHNLEGESAEGPPVRSYDLDRLVFNGRRLEILGPTHYGRPLPEGPDRIVQAEPTSTPGLALDAQAAPDQFTAEATVRALSDGGGLVWAAVGPGSYCRLRFEKETRRALVERVTGSETRVFETKALLPSFDFDAPHLLRLEPRGQGMVLTIDSGTPVPVPSPTAGALGWWDPVGTLAPGFTAWTAGSPDQSDLRVVHPLPGRLQGIHGTDQPRAPVSGWAGGLALGEPQPLGYDIQVPTPGTWGLRALVRGARPGPISVQVDGNPVPVTPPMASAPEGNEGWTLVDLGTLPLAEGVHRIQWQIPDVPGLVWDGLTLESRVSADTPAPAGTQTPAGLWGWVGHPDAADYRFEVTVSRKSAGPDRFGLIVRGSQASRHPDQVADGYFGYKISLDSGRIEVRRVVYERQEVLGSTDLTFPAGETRRIAVTVIDGRIEVGPADGKPWLQVTDPLPLPPGQAGWYSTSGRVRFTDPRVGAPGGALSLDSGPGGYRE